MSTVDTRLSNLNIWEGTTSQLDGVEVGVNDMVFVTDVEFEEKFRYTSMPEASDHIGEIVQYIGLTNDTYTQGSYYKSVAIESHIDTISSGIGLTLSFIASTGIDTFESFCEDNDSDCAYMEITGFNTPYSPTKCVVTSYTASGIEGSYTNSGANFTEIIPEMGLAYSNDGRIGTSDKFRVYRVSYRWDLIEPANTVGFSDISGEPRDNTALDEELTDIENRAIIQVTTLPEITEDTKDKIYQYVGENDYDNNLFTGSFYKAFGSTYELDTENSQLIDDMSFIVNDEAKFLQTIEDTYQYNTGLPDQSYFNIVFYGSESPTDGYATAWWIDKSVRPSICNSWNEKYSDIYGGVKFGGQPTITDINDPDPDTTPNTYFHILISKPNADYQYWNWYPISTYPYQHITSSQVLVNKSRYATSIIDKKSGDNMNSDGPNNTIIGVNSNGHPSGFSTVFGADNWGNYLATVVGAHNRTIASASIIIGANTRGTSGEYGICIGVDSEASERAIAMGPSARATGTRAISFGQGAYAGGLDGIGIGYNVTSSGETGICIGRNSSATQFKSIAIGAQANATGIHSIQIGTGTNPNRETLQVWNYQLLNIEDGTIPYQRLATNTPQDGYALVYNSSAGKQVWQSVTADVPVIQVTDMPEPDEGMVVQYIGEDDGELIKGYWYEAVYDETGDYWYWRQINVQPEVSNVSYEDLSDKPSINGVTIEGDLDLVDDFNLARVAETGSYADLTTKPGINGHPLLANTQASDLQIDYSDILNAPDPSSMLPTLPSDKDDYDYMLKWDHVLGRLTWIRAIDTHEDLGEL